MCGLFGFNGNPAIMNETMARLVSNKIKILGLYNIERGKHSCGVYINDIVMKGVNDEKLFSDFIAKYLLPNAMDSGNFNVIGHTRAATVGSHTADNAHPFVIDNNFVLAHNGQIKNIWNLCNKNGVNHTGITVDSHGLAHLINKVGFSVLENYEGWAALLMAHKDRPNSMYIYKGASRSTKNGNEITERPLYFLSTEEGMYLSSIEKSLFAISDSDKDSIGEVPANIVMRLENGEFTTDKVYIERGDINVTYTYPNTTGTTRTGASTTKTGTTTPIMIGATGTNSSVGHSYPARGSELPDSDKVIPMIWWETLPHRAGRYKFATGVIYHLGRYWLVDCDSITPMQGGYYINSKGKVMLDRKQGFNYWFIEGVMMKDKIAYETAKVDPNLAHPGWNFAMFISRYSEYPVAHTRSDINTRCKEVPPYAKYRWYYNEVMCSNYGYTPKFSDRHYTIKDGFMFKIVNSKGAVAEQEEIVDTKSLENEKKSLRKPNHPHLSVVPPTSNDGEEIDDAVQQTIDDMKAAFEKRERKSINELPFPETNPITNLDPKKFYRKFSSIEEANEIFSSEERRAIRYYITDILNASGTAQIDNVYDEMVDVYLNLFFAECIENDITIIDNWNDKEYKDILTYMLIARENPDGNMYDEDDIHDDSIEDASDWGDSCCILPNIPKPIMTTTVNKDADVPEEWAPADEVVDPKDDDEPYVIDLEIEKQQRAIREAFTMNQDEPEEVDVIQEESFQPIPQISNVFDEGKEERDYHFGELINLLFRAREEADELQAIEEDDFAQEVANKTYIAIDSLAASLLEITEGFKEFKLRSDLILNIKQRS